MSDLEQLKLHLRRFQNGVAEYPNRTISMIEELEEVIRVLNRRVEELERDCNEYKDAECRAVKLHGEALQKIEEEREARIKELEEEVQFEKDFGRQMHER